MGDALYQIDIGQPEYCASLRAVREQLGQDVEPYLRAGIYWILERAPYEGEGHVESGIYRIQRWILRPITMAQVAYRIDERRRLVTLLKIRLVNTTTL